MAFVCYDCIDVHSSLPDRQAAAQIGPRGGLLFLVFQAVRR